MFKSLCFAINGQLVELNILKISAPGQILFIHNGVHDNRHKSHYTTRGEEFSKSYLMTTDVR